MPTVNFPHPNATHEEVTTFYNAHGGVPRSCMVVEEVQAKTPMATATSKPTKTAWQDFDGGECLKRCNGWDGVSARCDCGNSRVCWHELDGIRYAGTH